MTLALRKLNLTAHVTSSVGWFGAVAGFLVLTIAGSVSRNAEIVRAAYLTMNLIAWFVIFPFALASLLTGIIQSVGTEWGFFRYYWVAAKLVLTLFATIVLLSKMKLIGQVAAAAIERPFVSADLRQARIELLVHAAGGLLVLTATTTLSVYKPWGLTRFGQRKWRTRREALGGTPEFGQSTIDNRDNRMADGLSLTLKIVLAAIGVLVLAVIALHLFGGGHGSHGH